MTGGMADMSLRASLLCGHMRQVIMNITYIVHSLAAFHLYAGVGERIKKPDNYSSLYPNLIWYVPMAQVHQHQAMHKGYVCRYTYVL